MADTETDFRGNSLKVESLGLRMAVRNKDFDKLLLASIDEALLTLGESAKQSTYFHIERTFEVTREEIPKNLEDFQNALEKIFGIGARYIEILIMKFLYAKIGCPLQMKSNSQLEFVKYVHAAKEAAKAHCDSKN